MKTSERMKLALKAQRRIEALGITNLHLSVSDISIVIKNDSHSKFWSSLCEDDKNITVDLIVAKTLEMSLQKSKIKKLTNDYCNTYVYAKDKRVKVDYIGKNFIVDTDGNKHNIDDLYEDN